MESRKVYELAIHELIKYLDREMDTECISNDDSGPVIKYRTISEQKWNEIKEKVIGTAA